MPPSPEILSRPLSAYGHWKCVYDQKYMCMCVASANGCMVYTLLFGVDVICIFSLLYSITLGDYNIMCFFSILLWLGRRWVSDLLMSCFQSGAVTKKSAPSILCYVSWCSQSFSMACDPGSGIAGSWACMWSALMDSIRQFSRGPH